MDELKERFIVSETEHFTLESIPPFDLMGVSYRIYAKYSDGKKKVAEFYSFCKRQEGYGGMIGGPQMNIEGTDLVDAITSWKLFKEFAKLADEAVDLLEAKYK